MVNIENYASLEASQRLISAGIVLETEAYWQPIGHLSYGKFGLVHENKRSAAKENCIPSPSMAEVWRELPTEIMYKKYQYFFGADKEDIVGDTRRGYRTPLKGTPLVIFQNTNPTDALVNLLIWGRRKRQIKSAIRLIDKDQDVLRAALDLRHLHLHKNPVRRKE